MHLVGANSLIHFYVFHRQFRMAIFQLNVLLCLLTISKLALSGKVKDLKNFSTTVLFLGSVAQNSSIEENIISNRNSFRDICTDLSSFNTECRYKHCNPAEKYRSIDGCCNNIGYPAKGGYLTTYRYKKTLLSRGPQNSFSKTSLS